MREYLEIKPRIQVLNERCRVFLDLAEILSDSIADKKMTSITWIIIVLIVISIGVTCSEVLLRFSLLRGEKGQNNHTGSGSGSVGAASMVTAPAMGLAGARWLVPSSPLMSIARTSMTAAWAIWAAKRWG
jgi:hypothetical protein